MYLRTLLLIAIIACLLRAGFARDFGAFTSHQSPPERGHVIIIGIDGLGSYYLKRLNLPHLQRLIKAGAHTLEMRNVLPTMSAPNWMSMLSGSTPAQHGVFSNGDAPPDLAPPSIFQLLARERPKTTRAALYKWSDMEDLIRDRAMTWNEHFQSDEKTTKRAVELITKRRPTLMFIHLDLVDHAGHIWGFGSKTYFKAMQKADTHVGRILDAVEKSGKAKNTVVIVISDHGGEGRVHGSDTPIQRHVPFIMAGPGIKKMRIQRQVRVFDLAPTVALLLGLELPSQWIGRPLVQTLEEYRHLSPEGPMPTLRKTRTYRWVYDDRGSGADVDVSVWRPALYKGEFFFGDVAVALHGGPVPFTQVITTPGGAGHLASPRGYEWIADDRGSWGRYDVSYWSPVPPLGYVCLGDLAKRSHQGPIKERRHRCVHEDFVKKTQGDLIWNDAGSGATWDVSLWMPRGKIHTFKARQNHLSSPGKTGLYLLK